MAALPGRPSNLKYEDGLKYENDLKYDDIQK